MQNQLGRVIGVVTVAAETSSKNNSLSPSKASTSAYSGPILTNGESNIPSSPDVHRSPVSNCQDLVLKKSPPWLPEPSKVMIYNMAQLENDAIDRKVFESMDTGLNGDDSESEEDVRKDGDRSKSNEYDWVLRNQPKVTLDRVGKEKDAVVEKSDVNVMDGDDSEMMSDTDTNLVIDTSFSSAISDKDQSSSNLQPYISLERIDLAGKENDNSAFQKDQNISNSKSHICLEMMDTPESQKSTTEKCKNTLAVEPHICLERMDISEKQSDLNEKTFETDTGVEDSEENSENCSMTDECRSNYENIQIFHNAFFQPKVILERIHLQKDTINVNEFFERDQSSTNSYHDIDREKECFADNIHIDIDSEDGTNKHHMANKDTVCPETAIRENAVDWVKVIDKNRKGKILKEHKQEEKLLEENVSKDSASSGKNIETSKSRQSSSKDTHIDSSMNKNDTVHTCSPFQPSSSKTKINKIVSTNTMPKQVDTLKCDGKIDGKGRNPNNGSDQNKSMKDIDKSMNTVPMRDTDDNLIRKNTLKSNATSSECHDQSNIDQWQNLSAEKLKIASTVKNIEPMPKMSKGAVKTNQPIEPKNMKSQVAKALQNLRKRYSDNEIVNESKSGRTAKDNEPMSRDSEGTGKKDKPMPKNSGGALTNNELMSKNGRGAVKNNQSVPDNNDPSSLKTNEPMSKTNGGTVKTDKPMSNTNGGSVKTKEPMSKTNGGKVIIDKPMSKANGGSVKTNEPMSKTKGCTLNTNKPMSKTNGGTVKTNEPMSKTIEGTVKTNGPMPETIKRPMANKLQKLRSKCSENETADEPNSEDTKKNNEPMQKHCEDVVKNDKPMPKKRKVSLKTDEPLTNNSDGVVKSKGPLSKDEGAVKNIQPIVKKRKGTVENNGRMPKNNEDEVKNNEVMSTNDDASLKNNEPVPKPMKGPIGNTLQKLRKRSSVNDSADHPNSKGTEKNNEPMQKRSEDAVKNDIPMPKKRKGSLKNNKPQTNDIAVAVKNAGSNSKDDDEASVINDEPMQKAKKGPACNELKTLRKTISEKKETAVQPCSKGTMKNNEPMPTNSKASVRNNESVAKKSEVVVTNNEPMSKDGEGTLKNNEPVIKKRKGAVENNEPMSKDNDLSTNDDASLKDSEPLPKPMKSPVSSKMQKLRKRSTEKETTYLPNSKGTVKDNEPVPTSSKNPVRSESIPKNSEGVVKNNEPMSKDGEETPLKNNDPMMKKRKTAVENNEPMPQNNELSTKDEASLKNSVPLPKYMKSPPSNTMQKLRKRSKEMATTDLPNRKSTVKDNEPVPTNSKGSERNNKSILKNSRCPVKNNSPMSVIKEGEGKRNKLMPRTIKGSVVTTKLQKLRKRRSESEIDRSQIQSPKVACVTQVENFECLVSLDKGSDTIGAQDATDRDSMKDPHGDYLHEKDDIHQCDSETPYLTRTKDKAATQKLVPKQSIAKNIGEPSDKLSKVQNQNSGLFDTPSKQIKTHMKMTENRTNIQKHNSNVPTGKVITPRPHLKLRSKVQLKTMVLCLRRIDEKSCSGKEKYSNSLCSSASNIAKDKEQTQSSTDLNPSQNISTEQDSDCPNKSQTLNTPKKDLLNPIPYFQRCVQSEFANKYFKRTSSFSESGATRSPSMNKTARIRSVSASETGNKTPVVLMERVGAHMNMIPETRSVHEESSLQNEVDPIDNNSTPQKQLKTIDEDSSPQNQPKPCTGKYSTPEKQSNTSSKESVHQREENPDKDLYYITENHENPPPNQTSPISSLMKPVVMLEKLQEPSLCSKKKDKSNSEPGEVPEESHVTEFENASASLLDSKTNSVSLEEDSAKSVQDEGLLSENELTDVDVNANKTLCDKRSLKVVIKKASVGMGYISKLVKHKKSKRLKWLQKQKKRILRHKSHPVVLLDKLDVPEGNSEALLADKTDPFVTSTEDQTTKDKKQRKKEKKSKSKEKKKMLRASQIDSEIASFSESLELDQGTSNDSTNFVPRSYSLSESDNKVTSSSMISCSKKKKKKKKKHSKKKKNRSSSNVSSTTHDGFIEGETSNDDHEPIILVRRLNAKYLICD